MNMRIDKIEYGATSPNRTVYASPPVGGSGFVRIGHGYAIPTANLRYSLSALVFASQSLIRAAKMSQTAGTLCAIVPKIDWKFIE
jgi:hypothetical protein